MLVAAAIPKSQAFAIFSESKQGRTKKCMGIREGMQTLGEDHSGSWRKRACVGAGAPAWMLAQVWACMRMRVWARGNRMVDGILWAWLWLRDEGAAMSVGCQAGPSYRKQHVQFHLFPRFGVPGSSQKCSQGFLQHLLGVGYRGMCETMCFMAWCGLSVPGASQDAVRAKFRQQLLGVGASQSVGRAVLLQHWLGVECRGCAKQQYVLIALCRAWRLRHMPFCGLHTCFHVAFINVDVIIKV